MLSLIPIYTLSYVYTQVKAMLGAEKEHLLSELVGVYVLDINVLFGAEK